MENEKKLTRSSNRMIAGVCAGIAEYFGWDATLLSETPARIMGVLDRKGTLERGKDADIIALDRDLNVRAVWAMGQLVEGTNKLF